MLMEAECMKRGSHHRTDPCYGIFGGILLHLAYGRWPAVLYSSTLHRGFGSTQEMLISMQVVAPQKSRRFLSYLVGWCVLVGEISTSSSCALNSADIVGALVEIIHPEVHWKVCIMLNH